LERAGLRCQRDLMFLMPLGLREWPAVVPAAEVEEGHPARVRGKIVAARLQRTGGRRSTFRATLEDSSGQVDALWFNQPWMAEALATGDEVELAGKVVRARGKLALVAPRVGREERPLPPAGALEPIYPSAEGIGAHTLAGWCREVAEGHAAGVCELLPKTVLADLDLPSLPSALAAAHAPANRPVFEAARRRLAFEPLLAVQAKVHARRGSQAGGGARAVRIRAELDRELLRRFPFEFTAGQKEVVKELRRDLARRAPMRRLLQGEVGAGKTVLALYAAMAVVENDGQAAIMAPTEVLAEQHYYGAAELLREAGIEVGLLTASLQRDERRFLTQRLACGEVQVVFGTHALFSSDVVFQRLDLAVIDEQHRFGVGQRAALADKGVDVHLLLMTATPIPRTLALTVYGDLEVSTLRELPPGRGTIETRWIPPDEVKGISSFLAERLELGEQVYWVCPRIGANGEGGAGRTAAAERRYRQALDSPLAPFGIELVHGRLPAEERAWHLDRFRRGEIGMLVATTVIEVGVDVPAATVVVIENAERLGLAQLHQLRGRVGRGARDAWCFLVGDPKAHERFQLLERSQDGFEIAEADLAQRGMGDLAGVRQSGVNLEGLVDPERDLDLVLAARDVMKARPQLRDHYLARATAAESASP